MSGSGLARGFVGENASGREALPERLRAGLDRLWHRARRRHRGVDVARDAFARRLLAAAARRAVDAPVAAGARPERLVARCLSALHFEDLYLAAGCTADPPGDAAREQFTRRFAPLIENVAGPYLAGEAEVEDCRQEILSLLLLPDYRGPGKAGLLDQYSGAAPLEAWVAAVVRRRCLNRLDQAARERSRLEAQARNPPAPPPRAAPSSGLLRALEKAIAGARHTLGDRETLALKFYYLHRLPLLKIGELIYGRALSRASISRRLRQAREALRKALEEGIRRHVLDADDIPETEKDLDAILGEVLPRLLDLRQFEAKESRKPG